MPGLDWRFDGIPCRDQMDSYPSRILGEEFTFEFVFRDRREDVAGLHERHADALSRLRYANGEHLHIFAPKRGRPLYQEHPPEGSLLVRVDLASDAPDEKRARVPTMWGMVTGGDDATPATGSPKKVEVAVTYLADIGEFEDKAAVRTALETEGVLL